MPLCYVISYIHRFLELGCGHFSGQLFCLLQLLKRVWKQKWFWSASHTKERNHRYIYIYIYSTNAVTWVLALSASPAPHRGLSTEVNQLSSLITPLHTAESSLCIYSMVLLRIHVSPCDRDCEQLTTMCFFFFFLSPQIHYIHHISRPLLKSRAVMWQGSN